MLPTDRCLHFFNNLFEKTGDGDKNEGCKKKKNNNCVYMCGVVFAATYRSIKTS